MKIGGKQVYVFTLWGEDDVTKNLEYWQNRWVVEKEEDETGMILMKLVHRIKGQELLMWTAPWHFEYSFEPYVVVGKSAVDELEEFEDKYIFSAAAADEEDIV